MAVISPSNSPYHRSHTTGNTDSESDLESLADSIPPSLHHVACISLGDTINNYLLAGYELQFSKVPRGAYGWQPLAIVNHEHSPQDSNVREPSVVPFLRWWGRRWRESNLQCPFVLWVRKNLIQNSANIPALSHHIKLFYLLHTCLFQLSQPPITYFSCTFTN